MNWKESLAADIRQWCLKHDLWQNIRIFFDGKMLSSDPCSLNGIIAETLSEDLYLHEGVNPADFFDYVNPETLSMAFGNPLYYIVNAYSVDFEILEDEFQSLFIPYGYYYQLGDAWNLSACPLP